MATWKNSKKKTTKKKSEADLESWNKWVAAAEEEVAKEDVSKNKEIPDTKNRMFYPEEIEQSSYIMKENGKQVKKTTTESPDADSGYIQNEEQKQSTLWKNIRGKDE